MASSSLAFAWHKAKVSQCTSRCARPLAFSASWLSTTARGAKFERDCVKALNQAYAGAMDLNVIGGKGDKGQDFVGWWHLKGEGQKSAQTLRIIGQCKAFSSPIGPSHIREFDAVVRVTQNSSQHQVLGIMCAQHGFTSASYSALRSASSPLLLYRQDVQDSFRLLGNWYARTWLVSEQQSRKKPPEGRVEGQAYLLGNGFRA